VPQPDKNSKPSEEPKDMCPQKDNIPSQRKEIPEKPLQPAIEDDCPVEVAPKSLDFDTVKYSKGFEIDNFFS